MTGITFPICFIDGLWRCVNKSFPGIPPYGYLGWSWFSVAEARSVCGSRGGNILNMEHLKKIVRALAGDVSSGGKAKGGGFLIAATLFFHKHTICLQSTVMLKGETKKKRSNEAIPPATNGDNPSRVCPLAGWRGWLERGSRMLLKSGTITADGRHARTVLRCSNESYLCPLPGAVASSQILQISPLRKCPGGHDTDNDG